MDIKTKPPIGIKPLFIHNLERMSDIRDAMDRYSNEGLDYPNEWAEEYYHLLVWSSSHGH